MNVTKEELKELLDEGKPLNEIFNFTPGQDCEIYAAYDFDKAKPDDIIYIPDIDLNEICVDSTVYYDDEIEHIMSCCYTKQDFIDECKGNEKLAWDLFCAVDWQHPDVIADLLCGWDESEEEEFYETYGCSLKDFD